MMYYLRQGHIFNNRPFNILLIGQYFNLRKSHVTLTFHFHVNE